MDELKEFATLVFKARKNSDYVSIMKAREYHEKMVVTKKMFPVYIKLFNELNYLIRLYNSNYNREHL